MGLQISRDLYTKTKEKSPLRQTPCRHGKVFHELARQKECTILQGHLVADHVHMLIAIPPKHPVSSIIGYLKGKSAIAVARSQGKQRNFHGENFWARGYAVSTVGFEEQVIRQYIREQEDEETATGSF